MSPPRQTRPRPQVTQPAASAKERRAEEKRLLRRVLQGDQPAWAEFRHRYQRLIVSCVLKVLRRYDVRFGAEDLADLTAEVWVVLLRDDMYKLRAYNVSRGYSLGSWIGLMAINSTIDQLRQRVEPYTCIDDPELLERSLVDASQPDQGVQEREIANLARRALVELSGEERAFVVSCFHEERNPEELAQELGIRVNTVYSRKFKIREKLSRIIAELEGRDTSTESAA